MKVKTRFAPSPTGFLHIGGLRGALYAYLFAKQNKGKLVLRIEDTDRSREVKGAVPSLVQTLQKMGIKWDEGPFMNKTLDVKEKGQNKPYFQSKRLDIYQSYAQKLIDSGNAYYCFCSPERLAKLRQEQQAKKQPSKYDGCCREKNRRPLDAARDRPKIEDRLVLRSPKDEGGRSKTDLSSEVRRTKEEDRRSMNKDQFVIRLKVPENGEVGFKDLIRGRVNFQMEDIDDQILIKSDGYPTYHLAVVVDDHLMGITHVIRGEEWISPTPKHILIYKALGWELPQFAHLPLLLNPDHSKLSKRQGDVAVEDYLEKGYLPEALINYVALLGWHPKDDREIFSLKGLIKEFDIKRVQKGGAIFDLEKLNWFNCHYIRQKSSKELLKLCQKFLPDIDKKLLLKILEIQKERLETISEIGERAKFFFKLPDYEAKLLIFKKSDEEKTKLGLKKVLEKLQTVKEKDWKTGRLKDCLTNIVKENNLTNGDVFWPARVAVSGLEKSPPPEEVMDVLGKEESLTRIKKGIDKL